MSAGKTASQLSHAAVQTILNCIKQDPDREKEYHSDGIGTKVCLAVPSLREILKAYEQAQQSGLPCALITDSGHQSFFNGEPTVTALGIGPATRSEVNHITRKFPLIP